MRIETVDTWVVNVPLTQAFTSSFETKAGTTRTVVRVRTDDGVVGWGETMHGRPVATLIDKLAPKVIGTDPFELERMAKTLEMVPFFYGYLGYAALAGLDIACWDIIGKVSGQPLSRLLGGSFRPAVPLTALITRADAGPSPTDLPQQVAEAARMTRERWGFDAIKLKGTSDPVGDVAIMEALRTAHPDAKLRVDPNAAWTVHETIEAGRRLSPLGLEYLEDPCPGIEGMALVRQRVGIPLCTNMCVVRFDDFAPAVRAGAIDVLHGDVHKWGSIMGTKQLGRLCSTFGLGMNLHSGGELGLSTAAHLHLAVAMPELRYAIDSMYYLLADDILPERLPITNGAMTAPTGPGLGVELDMTQLERYAAANAQNGDHTL